MTNTPTPRRNIGIPYARADVDGAGYYVTCPICNATFHGNTKSAPRAYAVHYSENHHDDAQEARDS